MIPTEQWQWSLYASALCPKFCYCYVPSIFGKWMGRERTGPAFLPNQSWQANRITPFTPELVAPIHVGDAPEQFKSRYV